MTARDVRDAVLDVYARILRARGMTLNDADLTALELLAAAEGRGVRFTAPAHPDNPDADWTRPVQPAEPGGDYRAARERLTTPMPVAAPQPTEAGERFNHERNQTLAARIDGDPEGESR